MGSPSPSTFSLPSTLYYRAPSHENKSDASIRTSPERNVRRSGTESCLENDENASPDKLASKLEPLDTSSLETKKSPPISSPPPKKRRIVGSWDEDGDHKDEIGAASPGMFRSPLPDENMKGGRIYFVSFYRPE